MYNNCARGCDFGFFLVSGRNGTKEMPCKHCEAGKAAPPVHPESLGIIADGIIQSTLKEVDLFLSEVESDIFASQYSERIKKLRGRILTSKERLLNVIK